MFGKLSRFLLSLIVFCVKQKLEQESYRNTCNSSV